MFEVTVLVVTGLVLLLGISKHSRPTNRNVATFEKSLPAIFRSFCRPMTLAYCITQHPH